MKVQIVVDEKEVKLRGIYHPKLIELYRSFDGYVWDAEKRYGVFAIENKDQLISKIVKLGVGVDQVSAFSTIQLPDNIVKYLWTPETFEVFLQPFSRKVLATAICLIKMFHNLMFYSCLGNRPL
jgi:hypothetical protein